MVQEPVVKPSKENVASKEIKTDGVTLNNRGDGYYEYNNGLYRKDALQELRPDLFLRADTSNQISTNFGTTFPKMAFKGDIFVRVDVLPNRVFKFDGKKWLEQNKTMTQSYLDKDYIEFLISKVDSGEYDLDVLSDTEKAEVEAYLKGNQNS